MIFSTKNTKKFLERGRGGTAPFPDLSPVRRGILLPHLWVRPLLAEIHSGDPCNIYLHGLGFL